MRVVFLATAAVLAPASAFAVDYLTAEQAFKLMFPEADRFEPHEFSLDGAQIQDLEARGLRARSVHWTVTVARRAGKTVGYVVVDNVIGKSELITYAVGIGLDGAIRQVEILSYRESHGQEIRLPGWRRQFVGKTTVSPLRNSDDIANISGATLSCNHVTDGIKRIVAVMDVLRRGGGLP